MTIAALLGHHGMHAPRWVTVDGQIVFDGVSGATGAAIHEDYGIVTPVERHTFHGGDEAPDADASVAPWWEDEELLEPHRLAMAAAFPGFTYIPPDDDGAPAWAGVIDTGRGRFRVGVILRRDRGLPRGVVLGARLGLISGRRWIPSPHTYVTGNPCVADQADWAPDSHTAATATAWIAHWLAAYTEWRITRRWPVEGAHAAAA